MRHAYSTFNRASEQIETQSRILQTLFPGADFADLAGKSQADLIDLLPVRRRAGPRSVPVGIATSSEELVHPNANIIDYSAPVSENGDAQADREWDESGDKITGVPNASDDINGLGIATGSHGRSYLGMTSMSAIFTAIFRLFPSAKEHAAQCSRAWTAIQQQTLPSMPPFGRDPALGLLKEQRCIDFYFEHVHAITPLIDEEDFRRQYASGTRQDPSWLGLLNMVFAMGSIASGSDSLHEQYYRLARSYIDLDTLGSGNLEGLQALCILGGYYLHYRNSPNMAYGVHGAAHRVAIALGLHREPRKQPAFADAADEERYRRRVETRRRTWWSLFCLDVWGTMSHGRPTAGRWDENTMNTHLPTPYHPDDYAALSLRASAEFCLICDRLQCRYAEFARLTAREVLAFDAELLGWYQRVPMLFKDRAVSPPGLNVAREFMRNRYHNARVVLSRSALLYMANDRRRKHEELGPEQQQILDTCCAVAAEAVDDIALYWTPNRVHVWNSAWYLFQACMVPLLSIAVERSLHTTMGQNPPESMANWTASLAKALETFAEMRPWMRASDRTPDIVSALYEALTAEGEVPMLTPSATDGSVDLFGWADEQMADMNWSAFLGTEALTQGSFPFS